MQLTTEIGIALLPDLIKEIQAGNEVLLTQGNKPIAKLVPAGEMPKGEARLLEIPSLAGHRVLTPNISQSEIADELFFRQ